MYAMEPVMITPFPAMVSAKVQIFTCVILATNATVTGIIVTTKNIATMPRMKVEHVQPGMSTFTGVMFLEGDVFIGVPKTVEPSVRPMLPVLCSL